MVIARSDDAVPAGVDTLPSVGDKDSFPVSFRRHGLFFSCPVTGLRRRLPLVNDTKGTLKLQRQVVKEMHAKDKSAEADCPTLDFLGRVFENVGVDIRSAAISTTGEAVEIYDVSGRITTMPVPADVVSILRECF